jgi:hypothetical protein
MNSSVTTRSMLAKVLHDILTEKNAETYCPIRILGIIAFFAYLFIAYTELIRHCVDFSLTDMATGISIILGVIAGGITMKSRSEN